VQRYTQPAKRHTSWGEIPAAPSKAFRHFVRLVDEMKFVWMMLAWTASAQVPGEPQRSAAAQQQAAIAKQRESIRKQAQSAGVRLAIGDLSAAPSGSVAPVPDMPCDPIPEITVAPIIDGAAQNHSLETRLLRAVIEQESGFHACAVSPKGAKGLMQLMPDTAQQLGVKDAFDPRENVEAGATYLKQMLDRYKGDLSQALGAYNAGPAAVDQAGGVPDIQETRDYVKSILQKLSPTRTDPPSIPPPKPIEN
jgi:soluble lytic murein transglycosylase-like protein